MEIRLFLQDIIVHKLGDERLSWSGCVWMSYSTKQLLLYSLTRNVRLVKSFEYFPLYWKWEIWCPSSEVLGSNGFSPYGYSSYGYCMNLKMWLWTSLFYTLLVSGAQVGSTSPQRRQPISAPNGGLLPFLGAPQTSTLRRGDRGEIPTISPDPSGASNYHGVGVPQRRLSSQNKTNSAMLSSVVLW